MRPISIKRELRRFLYFVALGLIAAVLLSSCGRAVEQNQASTEQSTEECRIVEHFQGSSCVPIVPQRVVTLDMDSLANMLAMDMKPIAASSGWDVIEPFPQHLQEQIEGVEYVGTSTQPNLEKILTLKPDLIVTNQFLEPFYEQLSQMAPTVVFDNKEPWQDMLTDLGDLLDQREAADQLINKYEQRVIGLREALGGRQDALQVSMATTQSEHGIYTYGPKYFASGVLNDVGLKRPASQTGDFVYKDVSLEKLSEIDGDVLIFVTWADQSDQEAFRALQENPLWQQLEVVKNEKVFRVNADHWYIDESVLAVNTILDDLFEHLVDLT